MTLELDDLRVRSLGDCRYDSPFAEMLATKRTSPHYVHEDDRVLVDDTVSVLLERGVPIDQLPSLEAAGPRRKVYFDPDATSVGIVTCGGLCPGLNDVIRGIVQELTEHYRVAHIYGFRNGYAGLTPKHRERVVELDLHAVRDINNDGGTILGSSRGDQDPGEMVDTLVELGIDVLFVIGGDGSMRGAMKLTSVIDERGLDIAVIGIPKTIDNDLPYTDQSFGFQTAFAQATEFIASVFVESQAAENGVGIVKLMGRHSGFIACYAALSNNDADFVLIPEVPFVLDGPDGVLRRVEDHVRRHGQVVLVVAEGAGQELLEQEGHDHRRVGQHEARRHRALPQGEDHRAPDRGRPPADGALPRPELRDPQRRRERLRQRLLRPPRPRRRARRDGRAHRDRRRALASPVRAHPDGADHRAPQPGRPGRRPVDVGDRGDGPARDVRRLTVTASQNYAHLLR